MLQKTIIYSFGNINKVGECHENDVKPNTDNWIANKMYQNK